MVGLNEDQKTWVYGITGMLIISAVVFLALHLMGAAATMVECLTYSVIFASAIVSIAFGVMRDG